MRVPIRSRRFSTSCALLCCLGTAAAQPTPPGQDGPQPPRRTPTDAPFTFGGPPPTDRPVRPLEGPSTDEAPTASVPPSPGLGAPDPAPSERMRGAEAERAGKSAPPAKTPPGEARPGEAAPTDDGAAAARFLMQASFGPTEEDVADVQAQGIEAWIASQATLPVRPYLDRVRSIDGANRNDLVDLFWANVIEADDQLRHRVAYALSKIVTASLIDQRLTNEPETFAYYMDVLQRQALGNYEDLIHEVTYSPAMGLWLSHLGNRKADPETGIEPDENYAREVMQLFTIGLVELNADGTERAAETYDTQDVRGLAAILTGLSWSGDRFRYPRIDASNRAVPMIGFPDYHDMSPQEVLGRTLGGTSDVEGDVADALAGLLAHPNVAPFVSRQLIQHLVSSNPTGAYVARVAHAYESGRFTGPGGTSYGEGRRGDMAATVAALLLDPEARDVRAALARPEHGKLREPVLRFSHLARAFRDDGGTPGTGRAASVGTLRYPADLRVLGQAPYAPPSVFGWFRPGYVVPGGWTGDADLVAPEMQLAAGSALPGLARFTSEAIENRIGGTRFFDLDLSALAAASDEPAALVAAVEAVLAPAGLTEDTRERITRTIGLLPLDDQDPERDRRERAEIALFMVTTSPEYAVQR